MNYGHVYFVVVPTWVRRLRAVLQRLQCPLEAVQNWTRRYEKLYESLPDGRPDYAKPHKGPWTF